MKKPMAGWQVKEELVYGEFPICKVKRSTRVNPRTLEAIDFVLIDGLDWVNIVALTPENEVVFVRQYRHGAERFTLELPGGCVDPGEDPAASALRELAEETGYTASKLVKLGTIHPNPAMLSLHCHCYFAMDARKTVETQLDPGEDIGVELFPLARAIEMVSSGEINHALVVAAFGLYTLRPKG